MEFFVNVGDWPLQTRKEGAVPILSWCGSTDTLDVVLPTYEVTHSTLETLRGVTNDLLSVQGHTGEPHTPPPPGDVTVAVKFCFQRTSVKIRFKLVRLC